MAKFQGILGGKISGKVGNLVFSQSPGVGTVAREYVAQPRNPQTVLQQLQRTKLANLVNFYRAFNGLLKGAFESKKASQSDYNAFVGKNLANNPVALTKAEAEAGAIVVAPYVISDGSLPGLEVGVSDAAAGYNVQTNINTPEDVDYMTATVAEVSSALLSLNDWLRNGMQISLLTFLNERYGLPEVPRAAVEATEFTIDVNSNQRFKDASGFAAMMSAGNDKFAVKVGASTTGAAWILSERVDGKLRVSPASIKMINDFLLDSYNTDVQRELAADSYGASAEVFLNPGGGSQPVPGDGGNGGGGEGLE